MKQEADQQGGGKDDGVWDGIVQYGMDSMVQYRMVWIAWYSIGWYGIGWYGIGWYGIGW